MEVTDHVETERETEDPPLPQPLEHARRRVALQQPEVLPQHLADRPVGDSRPVREAAAGAPERLGLECRELLPELPDEPCLADSRVAEDRHQPGRTRLDRRLVGAAELRKLRLAADESLGQVADPARAHQRERPEHAPAANAFRLPLGLDRHGLCELERAAGQADRPLTGEDVAR